MEVGCAVFPGCHLGEELALGISGRGKCVEEGQEVIQGSEPGVEKSGSVERSPQGHSYEQTAEGRKGQPQLQLERTESPQEEEG